MIRVRIYWVTNDRGLIRRIQRRFGLPEYTTVNGETAARVDCATLDALRKGEPEYLRIRKAEEEPENETKDNSHV